MTYAAVGIVKDEAATIRHCLDSLRPHISAYLFSDTGSEDGTADVIRDVLAGLPGKVYPLPFRDFGHSRSEVFVAARGIADWLLATDADMTWEIDPDFEPDPAVDCYMIEMGGADFSYRLPLVLNGAVAWRSIGSVHEYTARADGKPYRGVPTDKIRVTHHGEGRSSPDKTRWHLSLLEAEMAREPSNPRPVFYAAQSLRELGDTDRARELYQRRAGMGGFAEEAFYAAYRAALLDPDWPQRQAALLAAWESRPWRLEPLHALVAELNRRDMHHAAYALAAGVPSVQGFPLYIDPIDTLFVHRDVVRYLLTFERSVAAWHVGRRDECRDLSLALLALDLPPAYRSAVTRNLAFCEPTPIEEAA